MLRAHLGKKMSLHKELTLLLGISGIAVALLSTYWRGVFFDGDIPPAQYVAPTTLLAILVLLAVTSLS
jgi:hypothetical protein